RPLWLALLALVALGFAGKAFGTTTTTSSSTSTTILAPLCNNTGSNVTVGGAALATNVCLSNATIPTTSSTSTSTSSSSSSSTPTSTSSTTLPSGGVWAQALSSNDGTKGDSVQAVATDASGNVYSTGFFYGTVTQGPVTLVSFGSNDGIVVKRNSSGAVQWAVQFGTTLGDQGIGIAAVGNTVAVVGGIGTNNQDGYIAAYEASTG